MKFTITFPADLTVDELNSDRMMRVVGAAVTHAEHMHIHPEEYPHEAQYEEWQLEVTHTGKGGAEFEPAVVMTGIAYRHRIEEYHGVIVRDPVQDDYIKE